MFPMEESLTVFTVQDIWQPQALALMSTDNCILKMVAINSWNKTFLLHSYDF